MCQVEKPLFRVSRGADKTALASVLTDLKATPARCQACQLSRCRSSEQARQERPSADRVGMAAT